MNLRTNLISKKSNKNAIILYIVLLIISIFSLVVLTNTDKTSSLFFGGITLAFVIGVVSLIKLLSGCKAEVYNVTNSPLKKYSVNVKNTQISTVLKAIENCTFEDAKDIDIPDSSEYVLELAISKDRTFFACQLQRYVFYNYEPQGDLIVITGDDAKNAAQWVLKFKGSSGN